MTPIKRYDIPRLTIDQAVETIMYGRGNNGSDIKCMLPIPEGSVRLVVKSQDGILEYVFKDRENDTIHYNILPCDDAVSKNFLEFCDENFRQAQY